MDILSLTSYNVMMKRKVYRHRITRAGQVSIPAEIRERWGTALVSIEDGGDRVVLRPLAEGVGERLRGAWKDRRDGSQSADLLAEIREQELEAEAAKWERRR